jgi:hypothetical protein
MSVSSSFHKDSDGVMICNNCKTVVVWLQNQSGKWYLASGKKVQRDVSTWHEYRTEWFSVPEGKIPHFGICEWKKKAREENIKFAEESIKSYERKESENE